LFKLLSVVGEAPVEERLELRKILVARLDFIIRVATPSPTSAATMRWTLFAAVAVSGYFFFSDGDVGYLLTLSAMARSFALMTVRAITICRLFSLAFWSQAFAELKARSGSSFVGVVVLAVETAGLVLAVELLAASSPKGRNKKD